MGNIFIIYADRSQYELIHIINMMDVSILKGNNKDISLVNQFLLDIVWNTISSDKDKIYDPKNTFVSQTNSLL